MFRPVSITCELGISGVSSGPLRTGMKKSCLTRTPAIWFSTRMSIECNPRKCNWDRAHSKPGLEPCITEPWRSRSAFRAGIEQSLRCNHFDIVLDLAALCGGWPAVRYIYASHPQVLVVATYGGPSPQKPKLENLKSLISLGSLVDAGEPGVSPHPSSPVLRAASP
jgi:hypothetical protein